MIDRLTLETVMRRNKWKDYMAEQHYILTTSLFLLRDEPLAFKGGTCLWFFYGLPRFSTDLDFTATSALDPDDLYKGLSANLFKVFGIENSIVHGGKFKESMSYRIDAKGPFFAPTMRSSGLRYVKVEISNRETIRMKPLPGLLEFDEYNVPPHFISCMAAQEIACEKVRAIMTREKPRDVFDLWHLVKNLGVFFDDAMVNEKLSVAGKVFDADAFYTSVKKKEAAWVTDLKPIVFIKLPAFDECARVVLGWLSCR